MINRLFTIHSIYHMNRLRYINQLKLGGIALFVTYYPPCANSTNRKIPPICNFPDYTEIGHTLPKLVKSGQRIVKLHMKWFQRNIRIQSDAKELKEQISKHIKMLKNRSNIYSDQGKITNTNMINVCESFYFKKK